MTRNLSWYVAVTALLTAGCAGCNDAPEYRSYPVETDTVDVPHGLGTPVMTDGTFSPGEWADAARLHASDSVTLYLKQYEGHVFLGVHCPELSVPVFDLFLGPGDGTIHQLHMSAQLGERILDASAEDEEDPELVGGHNPDWYANEIRWNDTELRRIVESGAMTRDEAFPRVVFPFAGAEFQIKRGKFGSDSWLMRLEIAWHPTYDDPFVFPAGTAHKDTTGWLTLRLE